MTRKNDSAATAKRLHAVAIHLLRRVRRVDDESGLTAPKLSVLSVLVFGGSKTLGELATLEQVTPPTMTRIVQSLESAGYVSRRADEVDARVAHVHATGRGVRLLREGRSRRARLITKWLADATPRELQSIARAVEALERILRTPGQP